MYIYILLSQYVVGLNMLNRYEKKRYFGIVIGNLGVSHIMELEAELSRISRARYHMAVRSVLKDQDDIRMERMATAILDSNHRDWWKEVKKIKGRANIIAANIDGCSDENDIVELFNKYCDLYNSVPFNLTEMCHIVNEIETRLERGDCSYKI